MILKLISMSDKHEPIHTHIDNGGEADAKEIQIADDDYGGHYKNCNESDNMEQRKKWYSFCVFIRTFWNKNNGIFFKSEWNKRSKTIQ